MSASSSGDETLRCVLVMAVSYSGDVAVNCFADCVRLSRTSDPCSVGCELSLLLVFSVFVEPACSLRVNSSFIMYIACVFVHSSHHRVSLCICTYVCNFLLSSSLIIFC